MTAPSSVDRLRQAIADTLSVDAQGLQAAIGQLVVATSADYPAAGPQDRSLYSAAVRTTVLLADRIPAGQEAQALAQEIERHHGRQGAQALIGERSAELLGGDGKVQGNVQDNLRQASILLEQIQQLQNQVDALLSDPAKQLIERIATASVDHVPELKVEVTSFPNDGFYRSEIRTALIQRETELRSLTTDNSSVLVDEVGDREYANTTSYVVDDAGAWKANVSVPIEQPQQTGEKLVRAASDADLLAEINRRGMLQPLYGAIGAMHDHLDRTGALDERLTQYLAYRLRREEAAITGMPDSAARVANWQECIDQLDREPLRESHDSPSPGM